MMNKESYYEYYRDRKNFTSIIMVPYKGNTSMMTDLPDGGKIHELEKNINKDHLKYWHDKLCRRYVELFMPKFSISSSFSLTDTLTEMGIVNAFSNSADFSGISEETNLKAS
ncbi:hypothetical protein AOLI_G00036140 [Acnodon oligacanthus]